MNYKGFRMYHNGETFCCVHDHGDSFFVIYNANGPYSDKQTKYQSFSQQNRQNRQHYLEQFLEKHGYKQIAWDGAMK